MNARDHFDYCTLPHWLKPLRWRLLGLFWLNGGVQVAATHDGWWDVPFALLCTALAIEFFRRGHDEWKQRAATNQTPPPPPAQTPKHPPMAN